MCTDVDWSAWAKSDRATYKWQWNKLIHCDPDSTEIWWYYPYKYWPNTYLDRDDPDFCLFQYSAHLNMIEGKTEQEIKQTHFWADEIRLVNIYGDPTFVCIKNEREWYCESNSFYQILEFRMKAALERLYSPADLDAFNSVDRQFDPITSDPRYRNDCVEIIASAQSLLNNYKTS